MTNPKAPREGIAYMTNPPTHPEECGCSTCQYTLALPDIRMKHTGETLHIQVRQLSPFSGIIRRVLVKNAELYERLAEGPSDD